MTKEEAFARIKKLRDEINAVPENWTNHAVYRLDQAADGIEDHLAKESRLRETGEP